MLDLFLSLGVVASFVLLRLGERRIHSQNYGFLTFANADERIPKLMDWFYRIEWIFLGLSLVEYLLIPKNLLFWQQFIGLAFLIICATGRIWAINSLGSLWSMRCMYIPGVPPVTAGPYKYFSHPEYLARFGEMFGLSLFLGSYLSLALYSIAQISLLRKIIAFESTQLKELAENEL